ncbi:MAG: DUF2283 domain-containing protein [Thaumarchaeota archaeon]|nr:DUF2283 domain-containing protein [Nitrososphaerota archaeon]
MDLIMNYDPEADVLALKLREGLVVDEELLDNDVVLGYDGDGKIVSVEVLDASKRGLMNALIELAKAKREAVKLVLSRIS